MSWPVSSADKEAAFKADGAWYENHYVCDCGVTWDDRWSCTCDDDCPECGTICSPNNSEEIEFDSNEEVLEQLYDKADQKHEAQMADLTPEEEQ